MRAPRGPRRQSRKMLRLPPLPETPHAQPAATVREPEHRMLRRDSIESFARDSVEWTSLGLAGSAGLRRYKQKFQPEWHDRYLAFPLLAGPFAPFVFTVSELSP